MSTVWLTRPSSALMPRLLVVEGVAVILRPALTAAAADALQADGYLPGTPANISYISGPLKYFFDGI